MGGDDSDNDSIKSRQHHRPSMVTSKQKTLMNQFFTSAVSKTQDEVDLDEYHAGYGDITERLHEFAMEQQTQERINQQIKT